MVCERCILRIRRVTVFSCRLWPLPAPEEKTESTREIFGWQIHRHRAISWIWLAQTNYFIGESVGLRGASETVHDVENDKDRIGMDSSAVYFFGHWSVALPVVLQHQLLAKCKLARWEQQVPHYLVPWCLFSGHVMCLDPRIKYKWFGHFLPSKFPESISRK